MFAVYNNGSVSFRSTADNLYQVKNTDAPHKALLKPDDDDLYQDYLDRDKKKKPSSSPDDKAIQAYKKMANMQNTEAVYHVKDIMTTQCISIKQNESVHAAYDVLREHRVSQIPIITSEGRIIGLINKKIILNMMIDDLANARTILNRRLEELYFEDLITTDPISDIRRVAKVMIDFKLDAIPVVDANDILCGIVSKTDIIKAVSRLPEIRLLA